MKKLNIPFYAQREIVEESEKNGACGVVCVKMILDFVHGTTYDVDDLIKETYIVGGKEPAGWNHEALVRVLRNHGTSSYKQEFISHTVSDLSLTTGILNTEQTEKFREIGIQKIKKSIDNGYPVMVSVKAGFGANESSHIVLIIGYDEENFYMNDSQRPSSEKHPLVCSINRFKEFWKGLVVFVE